METLQTEFAPGGPLSIATAWTAWTCPEASSNLVAKAWQRLVLHPFDLATNKVLALVGRLEVRDWVDVIHCAERLQPLGYLAWAASGKNPGFSPAAILEQAARSSHYSVDEVAQIAFADDTPDAADLSRRWRAILEAAHRTVQMLPSAEIGKCIVTAHGELFAGDAEAAARTLIGGGAISPRPRARRSAPVLSRNDAGARAPHDTGRGSR
jgi:hypothetical protein